MKLEVKRGPFQNHHPALGASLVTIQNTALCLEARC